jgi:hypothetical protein
MTEEEARQSLSTLSQARYRDWTYAASLLKKNLLDGSIDEPFEHPFRDHGYKYACLHWHEHVTSIINPPTDILDTLARFLVGIEFVAWSETFFFIHTAYQPIKLWQVPSKKERKIDSLKRSM